MLRRVKKDVIQELTRKTEITVHCKLSKRQQAFYQAIKNKISLTELFDGSRGHLNEKKILNLMNIVIQLRKVLFSLYSFFLLFQHHLQIWGGALSTFNSWLRLMNLVFVGLQPSRIVWKERRKHILPFWRSSEFSFASSFWRIGGCTLLRRPKSNNVPGNLPKLCALIDLFFGRNSHRLDDTEI